MKPTTWNGISILLVAALLAVALPAAPAVAGDMGSDSVGAAITVGLVITVVVVYGLVALRSDVDRYSAITPAETIARAAKMADESPVVLQAITAASGLQTSSGAAQEVAGATLGLRLTF